MPRRPFVTERGLRIDRAPCPPRCWNEFRMCLQLLCDRWQQRPSLDWVCRLSTTKGTAVTHERDLRITVGPQHVLRPPGQILIPTTAMCIARVLAQS
jgi:hypothetical protein